MTTLRWLLTSMFIGASGTLWAAEPAANAQTSKATASVDLLPVIAVDNPKQLVTPAPVNPKDAPTPAPKPRLAPRPTTGSPPPTISQADSRTRPPQSTSGASHNGTPGSQRPAVQGPTSAHPKPVASGGQTPARGRTKPLPTNGAGNSGKPAKQKILLESGEEVEIDAVVSVKPGPKGTRVVSTTVTQPSAPVELSTQIRPLATSDIVPTTLEPTVAQPRGSQPSITSAPPPGSTEPAVAPSGSAVSAGAPHSQTQASAPAPIVGQSPISQGAAERIAQPDPTLLPSARKPGEVFQVSQGVTHIVKIARGLVNRIVTPFDRPRVLTASSIQYKDEGSALYVATPATTPVGLFISDSTGSRAISLTLLPDDIPQREITLALDNTYPGRAPDERNDAANASNDYVEQIKATLRDVSQGAVPQGYTLVEPVPHLMPQCSQVGISTGLGQVLESHAYRIGVFVVTNSSRQPLQIYEQGCYRRGVLAVAAWPRAFLEPGEATELYVVTRRDAFGPNQGGRDRPRLVRE